MHRVALGELAEHNRRGLHLIEVQLVNFIDEERSRREHIVIVERTEIVTFVILFYGFGVLGLFSAVDAS
jgi:hypothetical protein